MGYGNWAALPPACRPSVALAKVVGSRKKDSQLIELLDSTALGKAKKSQIQKGVLFGV